jgi:hypothetical protein
MRRVVRTPFPADPLITDAMHSLGLAWRRPGTSHPSWLIHPRWASLHRRLPGQDRHPQGRRGLVPRQWRAFLFNPHPQTRASTDVSARANGQRVFLSASRPAGRADGSQQRIAVDTRCYSSSASTASQARIGWCADGCQALGLAPAFKYERPYGEGRDVQHLREGASLPRLFGPRFLRQAGLSAPRSPEMGHFPGTYRQPGCPRQECVLFYGPEGLGLAPAYDLVCGRALEGENLADSPWLSVMPSGPRISRLTNGRTSLRPRLVSREIRRLAGIVRGVLSQVQAEVVAAHAPLDQAQRLVMLVREECNRQEAMAPQVARVHPDLF